MHILELNARENKIKLWGFLVQAKSQLLLLLFYAVITSYMIHVLVCRVLEGLKSSRFNIFNACLVRESTSRIWRIL